MKALTALLIALGCAAPLAAGVKIAVGADGHRVIYNESTEQRERRFANQLMPVPDPLLTQLIARHATARRLDPLLVQAVIQAESGYNPRALSDKGAIGLMQLMPETAQDLSVANPFDPDQNLRGGTTYLRAMLDRFSESLDLALAAYNAGPEAVAKYSGVPPYPDTREYVDRVLHLYNGMGWSDDGDRVGRRVFLTRDANHRIVLTTERLSQRP